MSQSDCYHCGEQVPPSTKLTVNIFDSPRDMCCLGCQAVSQSIVDNGLTSYYKHRTDLGNQGSSLVPDELAEILAYDLSEIEQDFVFTHPDNVKEVILCVENVTCAACAWLIEGKLITLNGLVKCNVNTTSSRISITWDHRRLKLSDIIIAIAQVGYKAYPFQPDKAEQQEVAASKAYLRKLIVAGLCTMQVMMFAIAAYFDAFNSLSDNLHQYFRWISLSLTLPVVAYSAQPFYKNALSGLSAKRLNMDFPVTIAISLAFISSVYATWQQQGQVYFESISMFTFFLLLGRFFEQRAKKKASMVSSNLLKLIPVTANRLNHSNDIDKVPAKSLNIGDVLLVKPGETIPADGIIIQGCSQVNEAVLTGEQTPVHKEVEDWVYASTINIDSPITIEVGVERNQQLISKIIKLQEQASFEKPYLATLADNIAQYVVFGILCLAGLTYIGWTLLGEQQALWIAIAVLIATCPCALSLATPSAFTCANATLTRHGLLLKSGRVLDVLPKLNHVCFDKTGTLTTGHFTINLVESTVDKQQALSIAAALEAFSQHPIASAFSQYKIAELNASQVSAKSGFGISGSVDGQSYRLGSLDFVFDEQNQQVNDSQQLVIYLGCNGQLVATFHLSDQIREQSKPLIDYLSAHQITTTLLTGDGSAHADFVANTLAVSQLAKGMTPAQKLAYLTQLQQQQGAVIAMFGDGVNDAPVLAGAHVSFAMGTGSDIAKSSADIILLQDDLSKVTVAISLSKQVNRIIKQNLAWALGYNLLAVPFAIMGYLPPYVAAIGMSVSSLVVVLNSLRLLKSHS